MSAAERSRHAGVMSRQGLRSATGRRLALGAALAVLTASCWWGWMAWDHTYQTDPETGTTSGPYQAWQVIGCVVCLIILAVGATIRLSAWLVIAIMTVTFTVAWSATAASGDETGLWMVGALLVFVGMLAGTGLVSGVTAAFRTRSS